jgi:hypothetical protein
MLDDADSFLETLDLASAKTFASSPSSTIVPPSAALAHAGELMSELATIPSRLLVRDVIGEGGMGVVRVAEQVVLGRTVAVKSLKTTSPAAAIALVREARIAGGLEHPNIVPVHDLLVAEDPPHTPSIVLKRIEGVEWSNLIRDQDEVKRRFGSDDLLVWNLGKLEGFTVSGTFVKLPPHHDHERALAKLAVGDSVEVRGEVIATKPNVVLHHVSVTCDGEVVFDHDEIEKRDKPPERRHKAKTLVGTVVAVGTRKHGEIDRLLLSGNVSVHLDKHAELELDVSLGDVLRVKGVGTKFRRAVFVRASAITAPSLD